jgi:hypothetical protein
MGAQSHLAEGSLGSEGEKLAQCDRKERSEQQVVAKKLIQ